MAITDEDGRLATAEVDFECIESGCEGDIKFKLIEAMDNSFQALCPLCHKSYQFDKDLRDKLSRLCEMIIAIRKAEDILGNCNVSITVPGKTVKVPYALLLTRLNTMITLQLGDSKVDFHFRVEPSSPQTFR